MKPSIPVAHLNNVTPDAIRWFIIGAYQAGASESEIVSLTNLSRYTIRYTIASFVKTGLPSMRTQKTPTTKRKTKSITSSHYQQHLVSSYDDNEDDEDELSESSSEEEENGGEDHGERTIKKEEQNEDQLAWKQSLLLRRKGNSTATDTMDYVLYKGRKHEEKRLQSWQKRQGTHRRIYHHRPPSPPYDILVPKSEPVSSYVSSPPTSPPTREAAATTPLPTTSPFGYWSQQDDKNLMKHILTRTGHWDKLDQVFEGKHSVADCIERWDVLQHYLIKEIKKTGTSRW